ncbi:unnamed protein product [Chrysoparadoxa australica]
MYVLGVFDQTPAGLLVRAYNQATSMQMTLSPSARELADAGLSCCAEDLIKLTGSIDIYTLPASKDTFIHSSLPGINKPKVIPTGEAARDLVSDTVLGAGETLPELLTAGLCELCKVKPAGLDAVQWLGKWLLANNPSQPQVEEPEE